MKTRILWLLFFFVQISFAQEKMISGIVSDESGPLPGVSVIIKGTTTGTETDFDGNYKLKAKVNDVLIFSFIGKKSIEKIIGNSNTINIKLQDDNNVLQEVVVTALGISKQKKSLGYAQQSINSKQLQVVPQTDVTNALAGKVSGVQFLGSSPAKFGGTKIRIRGVSGLTDQQPLYIVDGVPIADSDGNGISGLNPDDIKDLSILKGASASALYGSRGAGGVIIIVTKKGKYSQPTVINTNSSVTFDKVIIPFKYQNEYGGGSRQNFPTFNYEPSIHPAEWAVMDGLPLARTWVDESWGAKLDGRQVLQWDSFYKGTKNYLKTSAWSPTTSGVEDLFDTGFTLNNSVSIQGGGEKTTYRISYNNVDQNGILPGSANKRNTIAFNGSLKINDKLSINSSINYSSQGIKGEIRDGYARVTSNIYQWWQAQLNVNDLKNYLSSDGKLITWNTDWRTFWPVGNDDYHPGNEKFLRGTYWGSPFANLDRNKRTYNRDRIIGNIQMKYDLTPEIFIKGTASVFNFYENYTAKLYKGSMYNGYTANASFDTSQDRQRETNFEFLANYNKKNDTFSINANIGSSIRTENREFLVSETRGGLSSENFFNVEGSLDRPYTDNSIIRKQVRSVYGGIDLGYKDFLFLTITGRNDWSSALPKNNNSFFYPSISTSFIPSEFFDSKILNFAKIRFGYAQVGNDTQAYKTNKVYSSGTPFKGIPVSYVPNLLPNENLKPALSSEWETGLDLKFFNSRLGIDVTYYKKNSTNQILEIDVPNASGYSRQLINAGDIENKGFDLALTGKPIINDNITWDIGFNISRNTSKVKKLYTDPSGTPLLNYSLGKGLWDSVTSNAFVGEEWGTLILSDVRKQDSNGNYIIDNDGYYLTENDKNVGTALPEFTGGAYSNITYKGISLGFSLDYQIGGQFLSYSSLFNHSSGLNANTVGLNDKGNPIRDAVADGGGVRVDGVLENGTPHTAYVDAKDYFKQWVLDKYLYDATYIKLREVNLGYQLPKKWLTGFANEMSVNLILRNPWMIYSKSDIDPSELQTYYYETGQLPSARSYGFNIKLTF